ncbi:hypothetical protein CH378_05570 [Leptospira kmetyi]|uniref:Uncharacterized protein n=1 Tax=Leptospira kmetyi TaxID=408139 RepID=A0ABX4NF78_9LEPT|nr:hypothetical protein CH378_05570 [Leptospira kmetyi]
MDNEFENTIIPILQKTETLPLVKSPNEKSTKPDLSENTNQEFKRIQSIDLYLPTSKPEDGNYKKQNLPIKIELS